MLIPVLSRLPFYSSRFVERGDDDTSFVVIHHFLEIALRRRVFRIVESPEGALIMLVRLHVDDSPAYDICS